ncbi:MAG TPA: element excision factor XisH family protein [Phototrophicaceae bacterium]|nr:element excision factor XisH family protein [Phototrophicaceae bacterium]
MPAKDRHHDAVKRALIKDGWRVVREQVFLKYEDRHIWFDLQAEHSSDEQIVLFEIKGFEELSSPVEALESALGQYVLYQAILEALENPTPLFLTVPREAYETFLSQPFAQTGLRKAGAKLLIFDPVQEEIVQWIP